MALIFFTVEFYKGIMVIFSFIYTIFSEGCTFSYYSQSTKRPSIKHTNTQNNHTYKTIYIMHMCKWHSLKGEHARMQEFSSGGVQVSLTKKTLTFFFCFFLVLSLFHRSQMVNFEEIYHISRFQWGSNIFQVGSIF